MSIAHSRIINSLDGSSRRQGLSIPIALSIIFGAICVGGLLGFFIGRSNSSSVHTAAAASGTAQTNTGTKKSAGIQDSKTFPDKAEGTLKEGGIEDEGNFHLERPGGPSQYVYLTSSTVDLNEFLGKKVRVWGQSNTPRKAGWLMDVGYVEVL